MSRAQIKTQGLLAYFIAMDPEFSKENNAPPLTSEEQSEAIRLGYLENLKRLVTKDPKIRIELKKLLKKKPGPSPKLHIKQAYMLVEILRSQGLSHVDACEKVASEFGYESESIITMHNDGRKRFLEGKASKSS
jgi:hypothetical protein